METLSAEKKREKFIGKFLYVCGVVNGGEDVSSVRFR